jgi:hypothetical protein
MLQTLMAADRQQIPNDKHQIANKLQTAKQQIPNGETSPSDQEGALVWNLVLVTCLRQAGLVLVWDLAL